MTGTVRRWPLFLIAAPAAVSIWSGWVGLGGMCGFGIVHPLPGIASSFRLNTAITLPVGVEAYGAYALGAWLSLTRQSTARTFAKRSAIGSLLLGMLGQVAYHVLAAGHTHRAPWPIVVLVACLPVCTLGFGAALTHLLRSSESSAADVSTDRAEVVSGPVAQTTLPTSPQTGWRTEAQTGPAALSAPVRRALTGPVRGDRSGPVRPKQSDRSGKRGANRSGKRATDRDAEEEFAAEIAAGQVPTLYQIRTRLHVGNDRAKVLRQHIAGQALTS
jgi:hypothetical protein